MVKRLRISIEGNLGSGKSTVVEYLKQNLQKFVQHDINNNKSTSNFSIMTFKEPVEKWCDLNGHNLLQFMYEDNKKWAFPLNTYSMLTMFENHIKMKENEINSHSFSIMERSIYSNRYCFIENFKNRHKNFIRMDLII